MDTLDLLGQDRVWEDSQGRVRLLRAMTPRQRRAVVRHLIEHATELYRRSSAERREQIRRSGGRDSVLDHPAIVLGWLEAQPLLRELRRLQPDAPRFADIFLAHEAPERPF
ncbi:hypothetical protein OMK64_01860 [Cellulomonas fimi]|uniref:hypothetical protein n=1 Tax=Cellulomonas fimi TaxID=1708 RepID=UPI00234C92C4|nr:hypothetical protein [Cellulomonas fimi]MDC7120278.1 hypothetical protein [Cellulomonas fimi]